VLTLVAAALTLAAAAAPRASAQTPAEDGFATDLSHYTVPPDSLYRFGPKDAIPSIDHPRFVSVDEAREWLGDREPVAVVSVGGETRAYPVQILMHHDVVNDVIGGRPVAVTFCILCGSAMAFDRRFDGQVLEFGVAGRLNNSNLVIYDRQTETWWGQIVGEGLVGTYAGRRLAQISAPLLRFADFREAHPDGRVLSRETGFDRPYGQGRMADYEERGPIERIFRKPADVRLPAKERVLVVEREDDVVAFPYRALSERRVLDAEVAGEPVVAFWAPGTASVYTAGSIADAHDVGSAVAYDPVVDGRRLRFRPEGDGRFRDRETGSLWTIAGRAVEGPLAGRALPEVDNGVHFWFVWAAYRPQTRVIER
ncbi:MAG: DUF3179 domain-containing protein, partial [Gemmatimonadetes bacterium]